MEASSLFPVFYEVFTGQPPFDEPVQEENIALDFPTVADICIERVRRAAALFDPSQKGGHQDLGFRVYRALARQSA